MNIKETKTYWVRSTLISLGLAPLLSAMIGWLVSLGVTSHEGANGYAFVYVTVISLPISIGIFIFLMRNKKTPFFLSIPLLLIFAYISYYYLGVRF